MIFSEYNEGNFLRNVKNLIYSIMNNSKLFCKIDFFINNFVIDTFVC